MRITVIICTHNPNIIKLKRVLQALENQSLLKEHWELLIVDNKSDIPIQSQIDIIWHPNNKLLVENEIGLVKARIAGIKASIGELIVFVDDDNLLKFDFLEKALQISKDKPYIGAFGGCAIGEFEVEPSPEIYPYLEMIAVRNISQTAIGNFYEWRNTPAGAGLVIRKEVAIYYVNQVVNEPSRIGLDRKGSSLMSSGDIDLAYCAIDLGYLNGLFPELVLTHIIPSNRIEKSYLIKLQEFNVLSNSILEYIRFKKWPDGKKWNAYLSVQLRNLFKGDFFELQMERSRRRGFLASIKAAFQLKKNNIQDN